MDIELVRYLDCYCTRIESRFNLKVEFGYLVFDLFGVKLFFFQNVKKIGPPRRGTAPQPPPKFESQKIFGPPILSSIPDLDDLQIPEVNLKRQTFIPIQATMPQIQLPVISTPKHVSGMTFLFFL